MSASPPEIAQRLLARDPTAPDDLARTFLEPLVRWLSEHNPRLHSDLIHEAADDAILNLIRNPASYSPEKCDLEPYLRMSAQGDLRNLLVGEKRRAAREKRLDAVALSDEDGKYTGRTDDPALPLLIEEELVALAQSIPESVRAGLTECEARVLELMLRGERRTPVYAEVCGCADQPPAEQERLVKRIKDRLNQRIKRAREDDDHAP